MILGWQWTVRVAEGGTLKSKAPDTLLPVLVTCEEDLERFGHQLTITWRNADEYHQAHKFVSDEYRCGGARPQVIWHHPILPDLDVIIKLDHRRDGDPLFRGGGGVFRVAYKFRGDTQVVDPTEVKNI